MKAIFTSLTLSELIERYRATGRVVFYYPRKRRISLGGGRSTEISVAVKQMREAIARDFDIADAATNRVLGGGL